MSAKDFVAMLRPLNCAMAAFGTFIGYSIASGFLELKLGIGMAMAVAFLVCAGGMVVNDYFDRNIDKKRHAEKSIPSGRVGPLTAMLYSCILFFSGNLVAFWFLPRTAFLIAFGFTVLLIAYSALLARAKYLGNFVVAAGTAFTLVFGASLVSNYAVVGVFALAALFANLARELIKDLEDVKSDKGSKKTLPMVLGEEKVKVLVFVYYLVAIVSVYIPKIFWGFGGMGFVAIVSLANAAFLLSFRKTIAGDFSKAQKVSKAAMFVALLGFLAGAL